MPQPVRLLASTPKPYLNLRVEKELILHVKAGLERLDRSQYVHASSDGGAQIEKHSECASNLHSQIPGNYVVRSAGLNFSVGSDGAQTEASQNGRDYAYQYDS